ncbi:MAG TPA: hypothetical protein VIS07_22690 [Candidatus Binatia bacterium]
MSRTSSATRIWPPSAVAHRRAASITGTPKQSFPSQVTSPRLMPMRTESDGPELRRLCASTACCMATAALTASAAPEKVAMMPSPVFFTTVPWWAATASVSRRSCVRRSSSAAASPICVRTAVDPTRSVKRIVAVVICWSDIRAKIPRYSLACRKGRLAGRITMWDDAGQKTAATL